MKNIYRGFYPLIIACAVMLLGTGDALAQTPGTAPDGLSRAANKVQGIDALNAEVAESGFIFLSLDACGTTSPSCTIDVEKPAGATVRSAYLATSQTDFTEDLNGLDNGAVSLDGTPLNWDIFYRTSVFTGFGFNNHFVNITSLVKPGLDAAAPGITTFTVNEGALSSSIDGSLIAVIFDDPNQTTVSTAILNFGGQVLTGDTFSIGLADPFDDASQDIVMSLGISFGNQSGGQYSIVNVNGTRLTSSAGDFNDGALANGALITVGGLGDNEDNPVDPFDTADFSDDELYTLDPLLSDGDGTITVFTENPSSDDNIFFAAFIVRGTAAVIGEGITLGPTDSTNPINTNHTVTAKVQDNNGAPVSGESVDFEIIAGPNVGLTATGVTDGAGEVSFTWTSSAAGTDVVVARFVDSQQQLKTSNEARKTWEDANPVQTIVLTPENATNPINTSHTVTATVRDGSTPLEGVTVEFEIVSGPHSPLTATATTNASGQATLTWTGTFVGTDVVVARFTDNTQTVVTSNEARKLWTDIDCVDPSWDGSVTYDAGMAYLTIMVPGGVVEAELYNTENLTSLGVFDAAFNDITGDFATDGSGGNIKYTYNGAGPAPEVINLKVAAPNAGSSRFFLRVSNGCTTVDIDPVITVDVETDVADDFVVFQNFPNPFSTSTTISFEIASSENVNVSVYDVLGQRVRTILSTNLPSGQHDVKWDGRSDSGEAVSSGIYLYRVESGSHTSTRTMTLLK
jgi:hypothetical protein